MTTTNDLRLELGAAYQQAITVSERVQPQQLDGPTPCAKMDVAALMDHLVFASRRAATLGRGEAPAMEQDAPHIELGDVPAAIRSAAADAGDAWRDDASLDRVLKMPWGEEYSGRTLVGIYLIEIATHAWDLAVATGNEAVLDDALGAAALACATASIKPEYRNDEGEPFAPPVAVPDDATVWQQLGGFMGRSTR